MDPECIDKYNKAADEINKKTHDEYLDEFRKPDPGNNSENHLKENMKIVDLQQFIGHPAQQHEFDKYLTAEGVTQRPRFRESPVERINRLEQGISLVFESRIGFEKFWGPARDDGDMIFATMQAFGDKNDSGLSPYKHPLPYDLTFESTLQQAVAIFGEPTIDHESGANHVYLWHNFQDGGWTVAICFLPSGAGVSFFSLEKAKLRPPRKSKF